MSVASPFLSETMQTHGAPKYRRLIKTAIILAAAMGVTGVVSASPGERYVQKNLASDIPGVGRALNPNLVNPWGLAQTPSGRWWVASNDKGVIALSTGNGLPYPASAPLIVTVPLPEGLAGIPSAPTGIALNNSADFIVAAGKPAKVICVTEDGTISGWNPEVDEYHAVLVVDKSTEAVYKGVTLGRMHGRNYLYAANFWAGTIDVFDA